MWTHSPPTQGIHRRDVEAGPGCNPRQQWGVLDLSELQVCHLGAETTCFTVRHSLSIFSWLVLIVEQLSVGMFLDFHGSEIILLLIN